MSNHANLSPSKRHRWGSCPGSVREEAKYPEDRSSESAIQGTHTHTLLDWCLKQSPIGDPKSQIGLTMTDHDGEFIVQGDRAERVQFALDYIMSRQIEIGVTRIYSEEKVNPVSLFGRDDLGGTCDVILLGLDTLEIIDYKDGMGVVDAKDNPQMEQYLVGYLTPWLVTESKLPWSKIRMTIIQPKLRERGMKGIDYHEITANDVPAIVAKIKAQASATDAEDAPLIPGKHCDYCKHKGACGALSSAALKASGISFQDLSQQAADKEPTQMDDEQIKSILEAAPLIRQMLEGAEKEALRRFESGHPIAGLKAVRGRGSRAWLYPEEDKMVKHLVKAGLKKADLYEKSLKSYTKIEKLEGLTVMQAASVQALIKRSEGGLKIVPESDEREAVSLSAEHLFDAVAPATPDTLPAWLS